MTVSYYYEDVHAEDNKQAEEIAFVTLTEYFKNATVENVASEFLSWDLIIHAGNMHARVDVKLDNHYENTGRLPFEMYNQHSDGRIVPTWGVNPGLDYLAIVPWTFSKLVIIPMGALARYVAFKLKTSGEAKLLASENWASWQRKNHKRGRTFVTHGFAVPQDRFEAFLADQKAESIRVIETSPHFHRRKPQLLIGGKEAS